VFPQWVAGAAARDIMANASRGPVSPHSGGSGSGGCGAGIVSFIGIVITGFAALVKGKDAGLSSLWYWLLALAVFSIMGCMAYLARGRMAWPAGVAVTALSAYSLYFLNLPDGGWFWPTVAFLAVAIDQAVFKEARSKD
jgi:pheromone shutdown protein TraB